MKGPGYRCPLYLLLFIIDENVQYIRSLFASHDWEPRSGQSKLQSLGILFYMYFIFIQISPDKLCEYLFWYNYKPGHRDNDPQSFSFIKVLIPPSFSGQ